MHRTAWRNPPVTVSAPVVGTLVFDRPDKALPFGAAIFRRIAALAHPLRGLVDHVVVDLHWRSIQLTGDHFELARALEAVHAIERAVHGRTKSEQAVVHQDDVAAVLAGAA